MNRLPILINFLRVPFFFFIVWRIGFIAREILHDSILGAVFYALVHFFVWIAHMEKGSIRGKKFAGLCLIACHIGHAAILMYLNLDLGFHIDAAVTNVFGKETRFTSLAYYCFDMIGLFLAALTLYLQVKYLEHQEFLKSLVETKNGPRVVFTRKLTENQDGFYENVYGEIHIDINGTQVTSSYSY